MADLTLVVAQQGVEETQRKLQGLQNTVKQTEKTTNKWGGATNSASKGMNRMGVVTQQAGYQIGDFLVQVQSGTNFMVAFGQQATQLVGVLPMLDRKFLGLSAALGIAIPLVTAIGAAIMRTRDEAEDTSKIIDDLENSISDYKKAVDLLNSSQSDLTEEFGRFSDVAKEVNEELRQRAIQSINQQIDNLANSLGPVSEMLNVIPSRIQVTIRNLLNLSSIGRTAKESIEEFAGALITLESAEGINAQVEATRNLLAVFDQITAGQEELTDSQKEFRDNLVDTLGVLSQLGGQIQQTLPPSMFSDMYDDFGNLLSGAELLPPLIGRAAEQAERLEQSLKDGQEQFTRNLREQNRMIEEREQAVARITRNYEQELRTQQNLLDLAQVEATYGKDSVEYSTLVTEQERETYRLRLMSRGILGENLEQIMAYYDQQVKLNEILSLPVYGPVDPRGQGTGDGETTGGGSAREGVGGVARGLLTEVERLQLEHDEKMAAIEEFNQEELDRIGGHQEAIRRLEAEHQAAMRQIQDKENDAKLEGYSSFFGALASVTAQGGNKFVKAARIFKAAETLINAWTAYGQVLADPTLPFFAKVPAALSVLSAGLGAVNAIKSGSSGGGGGAGGGAVAAPMAAAAPEPQQIIIEGIDRDSLISGEQLSKLFDRLYEENDERGIVFSVAR